MSKQFTFSFYRNVESIKKEIKMNTSHEVHTIINNIIYSLRELPKTWIDFNGGPATEEFTICHSNMYVPNFHFKWSHVKNHYRVYIMTVPFKGADKIASSHSICVIKNAMDAIDFCQQYRFLHRCRPNNKSGQ